MKNILKISLFVIVIILSLVSASNAASEEELIAYLSKSFDIAGEKVNVPSQYIKEAKRYVDTYEISADAADKIIVKIDECISVMNTAGQKDVNKLSKAQKQKLLILAQEAAKNINATISYSKGNIIVTGEDGKKFGSYPVGNNKFAKTGVDYTLYITAGVAIIAIAIGIIMYRKKTANV